MKFDQRVSEAAHCRQRVSCSRLVFVSGFECACPSHAGHPGHQRRRRRCDQQGVIRDKPEDWEAGLFERRDMLRTDRLGELEQHMQGRLLAERAHVADLRRWDELPVPQEDRVAVRLNILRRLRGHGDCEKEHCNRKGNESHSVWARSRRHSRPRRCA